MRPKSQVEISYGRNLVLYREELTWNEAGAYCASNGGNLASVSSLQEKAEVDSIISQAGTSYVWLGGKKSPNDGNWIWINHAPWTVDFWRWNGPWRDTDRLAVNRDYWYGVGVVAKYNFICEEKGTKVTTGTTLTNDTRLFFYKKDLNFSQFHLTSKMTAPIPTSLTSSVLTSKANTTNSTSTVAKNISISDDSYPSNTSTRTSIEKQKKSGFRVRWYVEGGEKQGQQLQDNVGTWTREIQPIYDRSQLLKMHDIALRGRIQNLENDLLWDKVLKSRWTKDILSKPCLDEGAKFEILEKINTNKVERSSKMENEEILLLSAELFFTLHYCFGNLEEQAKLSFFYEDLLRTQNPRTVVHATLNNMDPSFSAIGDFTGLLEIFHELDKMYDFSPNLTPALMALSTLEQLKVLEKVPFLNESSKEMIRECQENEDCLAMSYAMQNMGK